MYSYLSFFLILFYFILSYFILSNYLCACIYSFVGDPSDVFCFMHEQLYFGMPPDHWLRIRGDRFWMLLVAVQHSSRNQFVYMPPSHYRDGAADRGTQWQNRGEMTRDCWESATRAWKKMYLVGLVTVGLVVLGPNS